MNNIHFHNVYLNIFRFLVLACFQLCTAQDSVRILPLKSFLNLIRENHPVTKQLDYMEAAAENEVSMSRGGFDPKYDFDYTQKIFKGTTYYEYLDHGLKIPTWIGADVKAGFEKNSGVFVNPTNYTPTQGLMYVGLDIPLGKGLWMDERRATLRQAQASAGMTMAERKKMLLKFQTQAIKEYLEWSIAHQKLGLALTANTLAEQRFNGIRERVLQGDLPSIDSVEAYTQVLERKNELLVAETNFQIQRNRMELYFWSPDGIPLEMESNLYPEWQRTVVQMPDSKTLIDSLDNAHPELLKLRSKVMHYRVEQSWRRNEILPSVLLSTKYLNTPDHNISGDFTPSYLRNNYKIQLGVVQPLFLRKEINKAQLATVKYKMAQNDLLIANRDLQTELQNNILSANALSILSDRQTQNTRMLKQLTDGEQARFQAGESSVFLVNSRENKWLEGSAKELDIQLKLQKSILDIYLAAGIIPVVQ